MFRFERLLYTDVGKIFISVVLGLGIATLFRKVCKDKECLEFHGPVISEIDDRIFQYGDECYKFKSAAAEKCDGGKKTVAISAYTENPDGGAPTAATGAAPVAGAYMQKVGGSGDAAQADGVFGVGKIFDFLNGRSGGAAGTAAASAAHQPK
jgi:hypothetical protein